MYIYTVLALTSESCSYGTYTIGFKTNGGSFTNITDAVNSVEKEYCLSETQKTELINCGTIFPDNIYQNSRLIDYQNSRLIDYQNSPYGNVVKIFILKTLIINNTEELDIKDKESDNEDKESDNEDEYDIIKKVEA